MKSSIKNKFMRMDLSSILEEQPEEWLYEISKKPR